MIKNFKEISIITPSYKRAGNIKAINVFGDDLIIACHEFEKDSYIEEYPNNKIMVIPDVLRGNMGKVRNYIKDNSPTKYLVMIDDDVEEIGYHEKNSMYIMGKDRIKSFLLNGFVMSEELGTCLWGINLQNDPKFYREYSPISMLQVVLGPFSCHIIDEKLKYDERLGLNEDYDFALQVLQKYHKILRLNKYYYKCGHLKQKGGCGAYRVLENEKKQAEVMIKKWGSKIIKYDFKKGTNPKINSPYKGI